jgi:glycosyltransferase involved in cell wall biosynthesis
LNILFLADNFPPERNAQASRVFERACYWIRWGHSVTVITCAPNFPEGKVFPGYRNRWYQVEHIRGIRVVRVKTYIAANAGTYKRILDFLSYMVTAFLAGLLQSGPDVVVATSPQLFAAVAACALCFVRRRPFVLELSDLWPESVVAVGAMRHGLVLRWLEKLELFLYRRAVQIVALTAAFKNNLARRGVDPDKISVVVNGVELSMYSPRQKDPDLARRWGIEPQHFVVGYIGTLGLAHALENVLAAAALDGDPSIRFLFVGPGAERDKLAAMAAQRSLSNVIFIPAQPKERIPFFWGLCDLALVHLRNVPLFETVIPSKIFEAMGMGLPLLLASPKGEASQVLASTGAGIWVPPEDPHALHNAVVALKNNRSLGGELACRSRDSARLFTRERQARELLLILERSAGAARAAAAHP